MADKTEIRSGGKISDKLRAAADRIDKAGKAGSIVYAELQEARREIRAELEKLKVEE